MKFENIPIVIVAYNRPNSLKRLLNSLSNARYDNHNVTLIISIDKGDNGKVLEVAKKFQWPYGPKKVDYQNENLGLRKHVLKCGSYSIDYQGAIILEDDLYVSEHFYQFALEALKFSVDKEYVGGISLYNHQLNVNCGKNFSPLEDGFDNWYFQFASSWGQAWTKDQWKGFLDWYEKEPKIDKNDPHIPYAVSSWSEKSWLKYFIHYLVEKDKYFLYPKISHTTNFSDSGTHVRYVSTDYQVPLAHGLQRPYSFSELSTSQSVYDVFFENTNIYEALRLSKKELVIDLYGYKSEYPTGTKFILSPKILNFRIIEGFGRKLKPLDSNILRKIPGNDFFLYDSTIHEKNRFSQHKIQEILYNTKNITFKQAFIICWFTIKRKLSDLLG